MDGVNAGGHWGQDNDPAFVSFDNNYSANNDALFNQALPFRVNPAGFAGGVQAGYNWQMSRFVGGLEADIDGLTGTKSRSTTVLEIPATLLDTATFTDSASDHWMSTVRARAGFLATERTLVYASGGVAWSNWTLNHRFVDNGSPNFPGIANPAGAENLTVTRTGWTVGGGVEYALFDHWLVRVEYLYANFGTVNSTLAAPVIGAGGNAFLTTFAERDSLSENIVRVGLSYHFH